MMSPPPPALAPIAELSKSFTKYYDGMDGGPSEHWTAHPSSQRQPQQHDDSDSGSSSSSSSDNSSTPTQKERENALSGRETKWVRRFRILTLLAILCFAVLVSLGVYFYVRNAEMVEFQHEFASHGSKVMAAFQDGSYRKLQAMFSLSSSITVYALESHSTWPFVTVPHSAQVFGPYLSLADAASLNLFPIVPAHLRAEWEAYSVQNQGWIQEDLLVLKQEREAAAAAVNGSDNDRRLQSTIDETLQSQQHTTITPYIKNYVGIDTSPGPWIPWWQYAPVIPNVWFINFNRLAWKGFWNEIETSIQQGLAALSATLAFVPGRDEQSTRDFTFTNQLLQAGGNGRYDPGEPLSFIFYPVFERFDSGGKVVAVLSATVYWKSYFQGILPDTVQGIICVVKNTAGQSFTYQVNGRTAVFLGLQDLHDARYDDGGMEIAANYSSFLLNWDASEGRPEYTGVNINDEYIGYSLHIYPSATMQATYQTNRPFYYTLAVAVVFVLTAGIFVLYDFVVERRQHNVLTTAVKSTAVVESVFPSAVREQVMEQVIGSNAADDGKHNVEAERMKQFLAGGSIIGSSGGLDDNSSSIMQQDGENNINKTKPIADLYKNTTILFADMRGFTAWCSTRTPEQVFTLLETAYAAFDRIAKATKGGVYKVETVGDCYVAVSGLPEPRSDHAVIMAKFARRILLKFAQVTQALKAELGEGTQELNLRAGLHSGQVTAGVIRGENARYQLFGDTMNTASRMESTGEPGRIQISPATMQLLKAAGKYDWFTPRENKVFAKGKGEIQTYWLIASSSKSYTSCSHDLGGLTAGGAGAGGGAFSQIDNSTAKTEEPNSERTSDPDISTIDDDDDDGDEAPPSTQELDQLESAMMKRQLISDEKNETFAMENLEV